ncbi:MAG TPA: ATP-binding protein, partial [Ktedonobacteraceae bacterium]|nr:ATP-binding protein [Ktedonobacteraceae bacterium]
MPRSSLIFNMLPVRAILETLLAGLTLWLVLLLFRPLLASLIWRLSLCLGIGVICVIFFALRLLRSAGSRQQILLYETALGGAICLIMSCLELITLLILIQGVSLSPPWRDTNRPLLTALIALLLNLVVFFVTRSVIRLWFFWNQLRRRQLLWALTHAHLMILLLGAGLLLVVLETLVLLNSPDVFLIVSTTLGLIVLSITGLLLVLPLLALFSYLVIRRTTQRLQTLAAATSALRQGNYAIRVPVGGEDEVARLQADFNGMAADLEHAMLALQEERDRVAALLQARREMIATVSHELRTPVATLRGYLETILLHWEEPSNLTLHRDLEVMEEEVLHLQFLVEELFTLARTDVGRLTLHCEPTDIGAIAQRVVETMAPLAWRTSKIEMIAEAPAVLPPALVNANRLEQVLQNLLHNAVRHTAPGGIVAVMVTEEQTAITLQVKDTGEGIAAADLPHIWERFYQIEDTRTRTNGGVGLGLALVKEWIEEMSGTVTVESVVGEGSCFHIRLPKVVEEG